MEKSVKNPFLYSSRGGIIIKKYKSYEHYVIKLLYKAGDDMSLEAIQVVVSAESEAEKQRLDALAEAKRIVAAAEAAGKEKVQKARESAEARVRALCLEAENQGKEASAKAAGEAGENCLSMEQSAASNLDKAVAIILERVVSGP